MVSEKQETTNIIIFSPSVARDLIRQDFKLVDIQPHKKHTRETVFYFQYTDLLRKYLKKEHSIFI